MRWLAVALVAVALAGSAGAASGPATGSAAFLAGRQSASGGFAEQGRAPDAPLTAWAALGLVAAGGNQAGRAQAAAFLRARMTDVQADADLALRVVALAALGDTIDDSVLARLRRHRPDVLVNETIWTVLALGAAGEPAPANLVQAILAGQAKSGGFPWSKGGIADSNDTAAAIEALRVAGVRGKPVTRAVAFLRSFQRRDGGFELTRGRGSDAQSTAWAIQGLVAAGRKPPRSAFAYLAALRRPDGSYRYSRRYATTPVWVTSQVLAALAKKPFPLD